MLVCVARMDTRQEGFSRESEGTVLNRALSVLSNTMLTPWSVFRPGQIVEPLVSNSEAASQAPTREGTPARETLPPPRQPTLIPEAIPEAIPEEPEPNLKKRPNKRKRPLRPAPQPASDQELNWRRQPEIPDKPFDKNNKPKTGLALVRNVQRARTKSQHLSSRVCAAAYDAVDAEGRFGLIDCARLNSGPTARFPLAGPGQTVLLAHTPAGHDPLCLTKLRMGDTLSILSVEGGGRTPLRIDFMTRAGYISPGRTMTSVVLGVSSRDWARALQGPARTDGI